MLQTFQFLFFCLLVVLVTASSTGTAQAATAQPDLLDTAALPSPLALRSPMLDIAGWQNRLIAVGPRGHILYSIDQGQQWQQAQVPVSTDLTAVFMQSEQLAFAAGHDGVILKSSDGGVSWQKLLDGRQLGQLYQRYYQQALQLTSGDEQLTQLLQDAENLTTQGADKPWLDIYFVDEHQGYVVGAFNLILKTSDGGSSWTPWSDRTDNPSSYHLNAITATGGQLWIAGEQGLLLRSKADGSGFEQVSTPYQGSFFGVSTSAGQLYLFGLRGTCLRSDDGGASWHQLNTGLGSTITAALSVHHHLYLASQNGQLLHSPDQGKSFTALGLAKTMPLFAMHFQAGQLWLAGSSGLMNTPLPTAKQESKL